MSFPHSSGDGDQGRGWHGAPAGDLGVWVALEGSGQRRTGWEKAVK